MPEVDEEILDVFALLSGRRKIRTRLDGYALGVAVLLIYATANTVFFAGASRRVAPRRQVHEARRRRKTLLISVICPSSSDCDSAYDYEMIESRAAATSSAYLDEVVDLANDFYAEASWGNFSLAVTYTPILEVDYDQSTCDDNDEIDWLGGGYDGDPDAFDVMAATASLAAGYDREDYDFNVVVIPYCQGNGAAGTGYVSQAGAFLNLAAYNYDPSFIHELGHNFGANHASYVDNDSDNLGGKNAWYSATTTGSSTSTTSGPRASETPLCNPCVSVIQATDSGTLAPDDPVAVQISTATEDLYLFVEYRSQYSGALMTYSSYSSNSGMTGNFGNSRVVDCEPSTDLLTDAMCTSGENMQLDVGDEATSRPISVYFEVVGSHLEVSVYSSDTPRPTLSMAPTTAARRSPLKEDDQCGKEGPITTDEMEAYCDLNQPTPAPVGCTADSTSWYKDGSPDKDCAWVAGDLGAATQGGRRRRARGACVADSASWYKSGKPDKDCAWVAEDLERCDSKEDDAGVLASVGCDATCYECTPGETDDPGAAADDHLHHHAGPDVPDLRVRRQGRLRRRRLLRAGARRRLRQRHAPRRDLSADTCGVRRRDTTSTVTGEIEISGEDEAWAEEHSEEIEEAICYAAETGADEVRSRQRRGGGAASTTTPSSSSSTSSRRSSDAAAAIYERMAALEPADFEEHIAAAFASLENASARERGDDQIFTPRHNAASRADHGHVVERLRGAPERRGDVLAARAAGERSRRFRFGRGATSPARAAARASGRVALRELAPGPAAPRVASSDEAAVVAALRKRQPIVVENSSLTKSLRHWTFQYLADHSGGVPRFHFAPKRRRVFPRKYGKKLMPGEAAAEEGGIVATTFRDFHELLKGAAESRSRWPTTASRRS
ncbi:tRNA-Phe hydroxylase [Aureococcus anophagefferens]|nr:tRNA-Phe hydroxylase [Aureococcus anophagefferens]